MTRIGLCMAVAALALVAVPAAQSARKLTRPSDVTPHSEVFRPASTGAAIDDFAFSSETAWNAAYVRAKQAVGNMTQDDKITLVTGVGWTNGPCVGNIAAISSINFPGYCLQDSPTGVRFADYASAFPAGINAATTWDRDLVHARSVAMGQEYRGKGVNIALTPMMNLARVAKGGRNWEGFGADPYLTSQCAVQSILGVQSQGVMANAKHFIANEQEHYRTTSSSNVDDRATHELYALPFLHSVRAGVGSFMCSYNLVNDTYACENDRTINQILKGEFKYRGFIMSDWSATMSGAKSINAGLDMTMPGDITMGSGDSWFGKNLTKYLQKGEVSQKRLDDMAVRILAPHYLLGQDKNFPEVNLNSFNRSMSKHVDVSSDHHNIIRKIGAASNVLLKNLNNVLPLPSTKGGNAPYAFSVIGSDAGPSLNGANTCADHGCDSGTLAQGWGSGTTDFPYLVTPLEAIQHRARENHQSVDFSLDDYDYQRAADAASASAYAIVFANSNSGEQYITFDGNEGDRNNMSLWHSGDKLIETVAAHNARTVVVIHSVGPVLMPWIDHPNISAVIMAGLPGQESGNSLVDVLFGDVNPSGRLIYTLAKKEEDYGTEIVYKSNEQYPPVDYKEGLFIDYRHFDQNNIEPLFPFGFGLSYTTFSYSSLSLTKISGNFSADDSNQNFVTAKFKVTNSGQRDGHEVAQLYVSFPAAANEPPKQLKGFDRIFITKGATVGVTLNLSPLEFAVWNVAKQQWEHVPGTYKIFIGQHSRSEELTATIDI